MATTTMDLKTLLLRILDGALKAMGVSVGMIFLKNSAGDLFWGASIGLSDAFVAEYEHQLIKPGEGLTGRIAETGETIFIEKDSSRDLRISRRIVEEENLNSFVGVPIYAEDDIIGVMNILSRPPVALHEQAVLLAGAIGVHVRSAIKNVRLNNSETPRRRCRRATAITGRSSPKMHCHFHADGWFGKLTAHLPRLRLEGCFSS